MGNHRKPLNNDIITYGSLTPRLQEIPLSSLCAVLTRMIYLFYLNI